MAGLITELITILEEQTGYYSELLTLSNEKKNCIIKNDIKLLQEVNAKENSIIGKTQRLDKKRLLLIKDMASVLNKKESEMTITVLAETIRGRPEHEPLVKVTSELRAIADQLKEANDQNNMLIQNALDYVDFSINLYRSSIQAIPAAYSRKGEEIDTGQSLFDAKQ